jgi:ABC-type antimicrobial peptide transport system permease subunit
MADENMLKILSLEPSDGQNLDQYSNENNVVIGSYIANSRFSNPEEAVGKKIDISGKERTVIGVIPSSNDYDNTELAKINDLAITGFYNSNVSDDSLFYLLVSVKSDSDLQKISNSMELDIKFNKLSAIIDNPNSAADRSKMIFAAKQSAIVALIMAGLCVSISAMLSINKKIKEIGIRKTIGATDSNITSHFLIESILSGLIGALLGSLAAYTFISLKLNLNVLDNALYSIQDAALTTVGILLLSVLSGIIPAKIAGKKSPIECLNKTD